MLLAISILSIVLSLIIIISNWQINKNSIYIGSFLLLLSLYSLTHYYTIVAFSLVWTTVLYNHFSPLYLLMGPLLYFYVRGVFADRFVFTKRDLLHFIPACVHLISITEYLLIPFDTKVDIVRYCSTHFDELNNFPFNSFFTWQFNYLVRLSSLFGYLFVCLFITIQVMRKSKQELKSSRSKYIFRWLFTLLGLMFIIVFSYSFFLSNYVQEKKYLYSEHAQEVLFLSALGIALINGSLLLFPEILYGKLTLKPAPSVYKKSVEVAVIKDEVYENEYFIDLAKQIKKHFKEEHPYLKIDFAISDLTIALKVPQHHITICFRDYIGMKFTDMKTQYRVEYAKTALLSEAHNLFTLDAIGHQAGFLSKSNFFSCFKKSTGLTPLEFQNRHKEL